MRVHHTYQSRPHLPQYPVGLASRFQKLNQARFCVHSSFKVPLSRCSFLNNHESVYITLQGSTVTLRLPRSFTFTLSCHCVLTCASTYDLDSSIMKVLLWDLLRSALPIDRVCIGHFYNPSHTLVSLRRGGKSDSCSVGLTCAGAPCAESSCYRSKGLSSSVPKDNGSITKVKRLDSWCQAR